MQAHLLDWLNLLVRWVHVIAGIMWIGDSFLFMWLDSHLSPSERAKESGVERVVFDRGGFAYHGRVAALADGAREAGLEF